MFFWCDLNHLMELCELDTLSQEIFFFNCAPVIFEFQYAFTVFDFGKKQRIRVGCQ
jgi:hypothetical protein